MPTPRKLRERPQLAIMPAAFTDETSEAVVGIRARPLRELVARLGIPHRRIGKRLFLETAVFLAHLRADAAIEGEAPPAPTIANAQPESANEVLEALGLRVVGGRR